MSGPRAVAAPGVTDFTLCWQGRESTRPDSMIKSVAKHKGDRPRCFVVLVGVIGNVLRPAIHSDPLLFSVFDHLPVLSALGSDLAAFAGACPRRHFLCFRNVLDGLDSRTFIPIFARQPPFSGSRAQKCQARLGLRHSIEAYHSRWTELLLRLLRYDKRRRWRLKRRCRAGGLVR
jgi:hypothetical protein